jgi:hypothetical protein
MLNTSANHRLVQASQQRHGAPKPRIINPLGVQITHLAHEQAQGAHGPDLLSAKKAGKVDTYQLSRPQSGSQIIHLYCPHCGQAIPVQVNSQAEVLTFYLGNFGFMVVGAFTCYLLFGFIELAAAAALFTLSTTLLLESFSAVNHHSVVSFEQPEDRAQHTISLSKTK